MLRQPETTADHGKDDDKDKDARISKRYFGQAWCVCHMSPVANTDYMHKLLPDRQTHVRVYFASIRFIPGNSMMLSPVRVDQIERGCRPFQWLQRMRDRPYPALLESSQHDGSLGQYSILCTSPRKVMACRASGVEIVNCRSGESRLVQDDPFRVMSEEFSRHRIEMPDDYDLPFAGGAIGYFSYDLRHHIESLPRQCEYDLPVPGFILGLYDHGLIFDHGRDVTFYVGPRSSEPPSANFSLDTADSHPPVGPTRLVSNFTPDEYREAVNQVKDYIAAGDIFQANLAQRFEGRAPDDALHIYRRLREINPAPFAAYLEYPEFEVISSSPERFLLLDDDHVWTRPIKGTRPRVSGREEYNRRQREELLGSEKDHAELAMIVDLERNDLGRVCRYGSVEVAEHAVLETYPTVYHLVSTVEGELYRQQHDEFDLLRATFPGGSITGAPKIRAMEIIEEIEPHARNVYTGSVGYISYHGRMDLNIVIRTIVQTGGRIYMQVGGGIVADSDPEAEYRETLDKGKALFDAVGGEYE